jgi:hypothetical protein
MRGIPERRACTWRIASGTPHDGLFFCALHLRLESGRDDPDEKANHPAPSDESHAVGKGPSLAIVNRKAFNRKAYGRPFCALHGNEVRILYFLYLATPAQLAYPS